MRKDFGKKPWLYPLPVLIVGTYDPDGTPNAMNAAWGGLYDSDQVVLCLSAGHKTTHNIEEREAFTVSFATADQMAACDYVGMVSGNDTPDKLAKTGWHVTKSSKVDAPLFDELPLTLTVPEVAEVLDIGRNTAYEIVRSGDLPSRRIGKRGQIRVLKYDLERYMKGEM